MSGAKTKSGFQRLLSFVTGLVLTACSGGLGYLAFANDHTGLGVASVFVGIFAVCAYETACT